MEVLADPLPAPEWETTQWFGSEPLTLAQLRGQVVVIEAFQMLCPGCVTHALPQAMRLRQVFGADVAIVGLHTVFEHHDAMRSVSLAAFLSEFAIRFPVGVDAHRDGDPTPITFRRYGMRGTPTTVLVDHRGLLRAQCFGPVDDMRLAATVARLLGERTAADADNGRRARTPHAATPVADACAIDGRCPA